MLRTHYDYSANAHIFIIKFHEFAIQYKIVRLFQLPHIIMKILTADIFIARNLIENIDYYDCK